MNTSRFLFKNPLLYFRLLYRIQNVQPKLLYTTIEALDPMEFIHRTRTKNNDMYHRLSIRFFMDTENPPKDIKNMTLEELDAHVLELQSKNKDNKLKQVLIECGNHKKFISSATIKKLFRIYSYAGRSDVVEVLQKYCILTDPYLCKRNGDFEHYLAKSQCMKGNSEKGLSILTNCYRQNANLRGFYRIIFRELIQDSILNRSEASLVIFKKYVLDFSKEFHDHYPLVCFWHLCWTSSWFSDQMLSNELLEISTVLQDIVKDKSMAFSMTVLRQEYNEDAVVRLLQTLLKYKMMEEYVKVLQVLFSYKLRNRDIRGCTEIIKNCDVLGISLSADQQGKYIRMLINGKHVDSKPAPGKPTDFKLKF